MTAYKQRLLITEYVINRWWLMQWTDELTNRIETCICLQCTFDHEWFSWLPQHGGLSKKNLWAFLEHSAPFWLKRFFFHVIKYDKNSTARGKTQNHLMTLNPARKKALQEVELNIYRLKDSFTFQHLWAPHLNWLFTPSLWFQWSQWHHDRVAAIILINLSFYVLVCTFNTRHLLILSEDSHRIPVWLSIIVIRCKEHDSQFLSCLFMKH